MSDRRTVIENAYKKKYKAFLYVAYKMCHDYEIAKDAIQDAFLKALSAPPDTPPPDNVDVLIMTYIKWKIINFWRGEKHKKEREEWYAKTPKKEIEREEVINMWPASARVIKSFQELPAWHKNIMQGYLQDVPREEIAKQAGVTKDSVLHHVKSIGRQIKEGKIVLEVRKGANGIKPSTAKIIELKEQGYTYRQISEEMDIPVRNVIFRYTHHQKKLSKVSTV